MPQDSPKLFPAFLKGKCPRCRTGNVFSYPLSHFTKFSSTNEVCSHCELKFEPEPGFYWGAMYISFAFSTGLLLVFAILLVFYEWSLTRIFTTAPVVLIILAPFMFRYSRLIMLYFISPTTHRFNKDFL
jgi:uncharacterized protein (DUF983 family)